MVAANEELSQRSKEGLAQLHRSPHLAPQAFCDINVIVTRFYALIKLEKVEEEEMKALLKNLPDEYAAMLGENQNWLTLTFFIATFTALMCWFVTLASKMTGREIPGVGMAPGGKIVKPEEEVHTCSTIFSFSTSVHLQVREHLCNMLIVAEAMSASKHWNYLAQYFILKEMLTDLRIIARGASAEEGETGKLNPAPAVGEQPAVGQGGQVGKLCFQPLSRHFNPLRQEEQVGGDQVDTELVEQLHQAYRQQVDFSLMLI